MRTSLSFKLLVNALSVLLVIGAIAYFSYLAIFVWGSDFVFDRELRSSNDAVIAAIELDSAGQFRRVALDLRKRMMYDALTKDFIYRVFDSEGRMLASSDGQTRPFERQGQRLPAAAAQFKIALPGNTLRVLSTPVHLQGRWYQVETARSDRFHYEIQGNSGRVSQAAGIGAAAMAMLAFCLAVWLTFRRALRPLRIASSAAAGIGPGKLGTRLSLDNMPREILPLIVAFNEALARVEHGYQIQQAFLATAAHELKTPLTLMRGQIELGGVSDPDLLLKDLDFMGRQVQQLLNLAECSEQQNYVFSLREANIAADEAVLHLQRLAHQKDVVLELSRHPNPVPVRADSGALFVLLKNLLENAIQYSPPGTTVVAAVDADGLTVRDHGCGIAEPDFPMLFQRFWRSKERRDEGAGLGLSICLEIALAHDWALSAENVVPGAAFRLAFGDGVDLARDGA